MHHLHVFLSFRFFAVDWNTKNESERLVNFFVRDYTQNGSQEGPMVRKKADRRGRPPRHEGRLLAASRSFRLLGDLDELLRNAAAKSRRSVSEEIEFRLARSFRDDVLFNLLAHLPQVDNDPRHRQGWMSAAPDNVLIPLLLRLSGGKSALPTELSSHAEVAAQSLRKLDTELSKLERKQAPSSQDG